MSRCLPFGQDSGLLGLESRGLPVAITCHYSKGQAMQSVAEETLMIQLTAIHGTFDNRDLRIRELFCRLPCSLIIDTGEYMREPIYSLGESYK